jgi:uncharacterized protein (DUF362 family)
MNLLAFLVVAVVALIAVFVIFCKKGKKKIVKPGENVLLKPTFFSKHPNELHNAVFTVEAIENDQAQVVYMHPNGKKIVKTILPVSALMVAS